MTLPVTVRLHDDVPLARIVVREGHVLRLSSTARDLLSTREVTASSPATCTLVERLLDLDLARPVRQEGVVFASLAEVTVVVPVRDNPDGVARLFSALRSTIPRLVVVDDASSDATRLEEVAARHGARLVRFESNRGPAAARNAGLRLAETSWVVFVDSDVVVEASQIRALLEESVDPRVVAVAPRVRTQEGDRWFERYEDACGSSDLGPRSAAVRRMSAVPFVPTACLLVRTDALGEGFDEELRSGEDVDLVWRLLDAGHRVRYAADVHVWHTHRTTVRSWLGRKVFYGTSAAPLAVRHGDAVAPAVLSSTSATMIAAGLAGRWWSPVVLVAMLLHLWRRATEEVPTADRGQRAELVRFGAVVMAKQTSSLLLRHWWPATVLLSIGSRRFRCVAVAVAVAEGLLTHRASRADLDPVRFIVARRAGDAAYGLGVWWAAIRTRSLHSLRPAWIHRPR